MFKRKISSNKKTNNKTKLLRPELYKENFFTECIEIANYKIYPFYETFILISNKDIIGNC